LLYSGQSKIIHQTLLGMEEPFDALVKWIEAGFPSFKDYGKRSTVSIEQAFIKRYQERRRAYYSREVRSDWQEDDQAHIGSRDNYGRKSKNRGSSENQTLRMMGGREWIG
jgi:hypothetical protein